MSIDYAARAAYEELRNGPRQSLSWDDLSEEDKDVWRRVAKKVQGATPSPFFIQMSIKVPNQEALGTDRLWNMRFGSTDAAIEAAARDFEKMMKAIRDETGF